MAAGNAPLPEAGVSAGSDAGAGPFVINLTSSTTPMALSHPDSPELKRFSFFVSRRREDNRERFRLHMGYFSTLAEAEEWLNVIRDLYPGAWAGEAPGKKLRARAAAAELAKQLPAPGAFAPPPAASLSAPKAAAPSPVGARAAASPAKPTATDLVVPTLQAAATFQPAAQPAAPASAAPMLEAVAQAAAALAAVAKTAVAQSAVPPAPQISYVLAPPPASPAAKAPTASVPSTGPVSFSAPVPAGVAPAAPSAVAAAAARAAAASSAPAARPAARASTPAPAQPAAQGSPPRAPASSPQQRVGVAPARPAQPAPVKSKKNVPNALTDGSNVREVMASLDETGETRRMQIPPGLRAPAPAAKAAPASAPAARTAGGAAGRAPSAPVQGARGPAPAAMPRAAAPSARVPAVESSGADSMSDTQVLRMLETRRSGDEKGSDDANSGISLLKPDDTQTRRALKEAVIENAPVSFAVQLQWSVQPVDLAQVPPLAIFSAYTLYTVEGSREGRKWYGLRLGFFSDAISAKQVAYYVRSEFASVAVVPVSPAEKARASDSETKAATGAFQRKHVEQKIEEFKLFDDDKPAAAEPAPKAEVPAAARAAASAARSTPTRKNKPLGRVKAKEQRSPKTLEETLEILGASDLEIDNDRGSLVNDTGVRHLRVEVQKNTPFAKLLDRISERVRKN
jgi:hypothetical protein